MMDEDDFPTNETTIANVGTMADAEERERNLLGRQLLWAYRVLYNPTPSPEDIIAIADERFAELSAFARAQIGEKP